jgi:outer membrane protein
VEPSDLLQAQASVQVQETELTLAESRIEAARNALLALMQRQKPSGAAAPFRADFPRTWPAFAGSLDEALAAGLERRGDVRSARAAEEAAEFGLRVAALDGLPDLSVHGSYGVAGLDGRYSDAWSDLGGFDHPVKSAGVSLSVPFGRRREKLDRKSAALRLEGLRRERERVTQNAIREIRDAWENLQTSRKRLEASRTLASLEERKLKAENEDFGKGRSNTDLMVRFQLDFHRARQQLLRARTDEALARVELGRSVGALVETLMASRAEGREGR